MPYRSPPYRVRIRGDLACFTRPEFKTERVSYEVITPSAARGILEAVLWKPAIRWSIERIEVIKPIQFTSFKRNEISRTIPVASVKSSIKKGVPTPDYFADRDRMQRNTLALDQVDYIVTAHFEMTGKAGPSDTPEKFEAMFTRRLGKGQTFHQPYLGCREFPARVEPAPERLTPIPETRPLGLMLYDLAYGKDASGDTFRPYFYAAIMRNGVIDVPSFDDVRAGKGDA